MKFIPFLAAVLSIAVLGCGGSDGPEMQQVRGQVTLDGKPIETGEIIFRPLDADVRSDAGTIENGTFSFPTTAGRKLVEISAMGIVEGKQASAGGNPGDPIGPDNPAHVFEELVPARYNSESKLNAEVTPDGDNEFNFKLESGN